MDLSHTEHVDGEADRMFVYQATNIVEVLYNLTYLICEEADHPEKVRQYASMSEERLRAMTDLLQAYPD